MTKLMVIVTKINSKKCIDYEKYIKNTNNYQAKDDEWIDEFMKKIKAPKIIKPILGVNGKKICEYIRGEAVGTLCYLLHGCKKDWMVENDLHPNTETILEEISKIINEEKNEKKEVKIGFVCHSNQWESQFKKIVKKVFKDNLEFCSRVSHLGDTQFINYTTLFTSQGNLNVQSFNKMWHYYSENENLKAFHHFLILKMIHLETVRVLLTLKKNQKASQEYENEFGNDNLRTFIEEKVKKNSEYIRYIRYSTIVDEEKNRVREHVEKLNPESYNHLDKNNLEVKPLEEFIQWFNKFSECVAEELAKKENVNA